MQRILQVVGKMDRAGAETMIMNLYRAIDRTQFQFDFVVFSDLKGDYDDEIKSLGGEIFVINESNPIKRMFDLKKLLSNRTEYKIIHCHTLFSNGFHVLAGKMAKVPYRISHSHNTSAKSNNKIVASIYHYLSRKIIKKYSTHFIGCGIAAGRFLFTNQKQVLFLPNSIDTVSFSKIGELSKDYLNSEFNLDNSCLKIIQIGRLQAVKNHVFSLEIAQKLKEKNIQIKMFFVGQGSLDSEIREKIKLKNLTDEVIMLGVRSDIPHLLAGSDVMLMPSLHEGFPVVLVEAQSTGTPSLISDSISSEVDLNLELVEFESLNSSIDEWVNKIMIIKNKKNIEKAERMRRLEEQGFDIYSSVKILSSFYQSMLN